jgi:hypothetical protein
MARSEMATALLPHRLPIDVTVESARSIKRLAKLWE